MTAVRTLDRMTVRRLAIARQHLDAAARPSMLDVVRDLGCLQLDPISAVARSHLLVLWSRLGVYDLDTLDEAMWKDRHLFEYWAHVASIVLTEHFPIHHWRMRRYPDNEAGGSSYERQWANQEPVRAGAQRLLDIIRAEGPIASRNLEKGGPVGGWVSGWTGDNQVNRLLYYLWHKGDLLVAGRQANQRLWDIAERVLPEWTPRAQLDARAVTRQSVMVAVRALGVATAGYIKDHFTRRRYPHLNDVLSQLAAEGVLQQVNVVTDNGAPLWRQPAYIHVDDLPLVERIEGGEFAPRTTLLSPFDNLICDRKRTQQLFDFDFTIEIYVPKDKRQYGYYVLPLLHGDRLIGRMDMRMDRKKAVLNANAVYGEPGAPSDPAAVRAINGAVESLATFLGASQIDYGDIHYAPWQSLKQ